MKAPIWFVWGLTLGLLVTIITIQITKDKSEAILLRVVASYELEAEEARLVHDTKVLSLEAENQQLESDILILTKNHKLLTTFAEAGHTPESISEVQELVAEFDKIPFGSPFAKGYNITSSYGKGKPEWYRQSGIHLGIDITTKGIWDVLATADGVIVDFNYSETLGKFIVFETTAGYQIVYGHLQTILWQDLDTKAVIGVPIKKGTRLAVAGNTGTLSTGRHLHMEIKRLSSDGIWEHLNPEAILQFIGQEP
jgi:murein DD-endopeptidase MepM/ murein hydrolase activator NlpD